MMHILNGPKRYLIIAATFTATNLTSKLISIFALYIFLYSYIVHYLLVQTILNLESLQNI